VARAVVSARVAFDRLTYSDILPHSQNKHPTEQRYHFTQTGSRFYSQVQPPLCDKPCFAFVQQPSRACIVRLTKLCNNTVLQKKKVHAPEMRPIYCERYGPIEKPYVRRLSRSKRVAEI